MSTTLDDVLAEQKALRVELKAVRGLLNRLLVPVEVEEARQVANMSDGDRKKHNRSVLANARKKQGLRRVA